MKKEKIKMAEAIKKDNQNNNDFDEWNSLKKKISSDNSVDKALFRKKCVKCGNEIFEVIQIIINLKG